MDGSYSWAQEHGIPLNSADLVSDRAKCSTYQEQR